MFMVHWAEKPISTLPVVSRYLAVRLTFTVNLSLGAPLVLISHSLSM